MSRALAPREDSSWAADVGLVRVDGALDRVGRREGDLAAGAPQLLDQVRILEEGVDPRRSVERPARWCPRWRARSAGLIDFVASKISQPYPGK